MKQDKNLKQNIIWNRIESGTEELKRCNKDKRNTKSNIDIRYIKEKCSCLTGPCSWYSGSGQLHFIFSSTSATGIIISDHNA